MIWMAILAVGLLASEQAAYGMLYSRPVIRVCYELGLWELWDFLAGEVVDDDGEPVYTHGPALATLFLCTCYTTAWLAGDYVRMTIMVAIGTSLAVRRTYGVWRLMRAYNKAAEGDPSARAWLESKGIKLADED